MLLIHSTRCVIVLIAVAFLAGCTTFAFQTIKDEEYKKQLAETSVVWNPVVDIPHHFDRYQTGCEDADKKASSELQSLFTKYMRASLSKSLSAERVTIVQEHEIALTQLKVHPISSVTDCTLLGSVTDLWIDVALFDKALNKEVWSAKIKVGAPWPVENDESVIRKFADTVISEFKRTGLLPY